MVQPIIWMPYCGPAPGPAELWAQWNLDPLLIVFLLLAAAVGWRSSRQPRFQKPPFAIAMTLAFALFVSPFCALTSALFLARTVHHLALTVVLAPMLAFAWPARRMAGGVAIWTLLHALTFWAWHAPAAYEAALSSTAAYWLMQASLLISALAMWCAIRSASVPAAIGSLLATMVQMGLLGALLTFTGTALYAPHYLATTRWGLTPLEDQQLAGLTMWAPGAGLYLAAALHLLSRWLLREQRSALAR